MKAGKSTLNPFAASYIPLSERKATYESKDFRNSENVSKKGNEVAWSEYERENALTHHRQYEVSQNYIQYSDSDPTAELSKLKDNSGAEFNASSSHNPNEIDEMAMDEDMDMSLLQSIFSGMSYDSLHGVYMANGCDLDDTIDMMKQLEHPPFSTSEQLPDTLDIGDVPESGCSNNLAPAESNNATVKAGPSLPASSNKISGI